MIRDGSIADLPQLMELGARLKEQTHYRDLELDRESATKVYGQCLSSALGFAKVAVHEGKITGVLLGMADTYWFARARYTTDLLFYSETAGDGIRLLRRFVAWSMSLPRVVEITCAQSSGIDTDRVAIIYKRLGFENIGGIWCMKVSSNTPTSDS